MVQLLVVNDKNYATSETFYSLHQRLCLLLVIRSETIDDSSRGEHLWEHRSYEICNLLHLV